MRTYTFFLKIWRWKSAKIGFVESDTECLGEFQLREKVNSHKSSRENWKAFEKLTLKRKTCFFRYRGESPTSRQGKPPKHSKSKLWKKFLSDFCDWKVYLWESHELSRENLSVSLVTDLSLANKSPKPTRELAAVAYDLDDLRLSRQNRAT